MGYKSVHMDKVADAAAAAPIVTKKTGSIVKLTLEMDSSKFSVTDFVGEFATAADVDASRVKVVGSTPSGDETVVDVKIMNEAGKEAASDIAQKIKQAFTKKTLRLSMPVKAVDAPAPGEVTKTQKKNVVLNFALKGYDVKANKGAFEEAVKTDVALFLGVDKAKVTVNEITAKTDAANVDITIEGGDADKAAGLPKGMKFDTVEGTTGVAVGTDADKSLGTADMAKEKVAANAEKAVSALQKNFDDAKAKKDASSTVEGPTLKVATAKAALEKAQKEGDAAAVPKAREELEAAEADAITASANTQTEALKKDAATGGNTTKAEVESAKREEVAADLKAKTVTQTKVETDCMAIKAAKPVNVTAVAECEAKVEAAKAETKGASSTSGADATASTKALDKTAATSF